MTRQKCKTAVVWGKHKNAGICGENKKLLLSIGEIRILIWWKMKIRCCLGGAKSVSLRKNKNSRYPERNNKTFFLGISENIVVVWRKIRNNSFLLVTCIWKLIQKDSKNIEKFVGREATRSIKPLTRSMIALLSKLLVITPVVISYNWSEKLWYIKQVKL